MSRHINLYDPALLRQRQWLTADHLLLVVGLLFLVLLFWGTWLRVQISGLAVQGATLADELQVAREQSVALGKELSSRRPDPKLEQQLVALDELLGLRQGILTTLGQGLAADTGGYAEYLRGMARQTVAGLWLTGFTVGTGGSGMEIRGRILDPALLPEYIRRLNRERAFHGHRFAALNVGIPAPANPATGQVGVVGATPPLRPAPPTFHEFALVPEQDAGTAAGRAQ